MTPSKMPPPLTPRAAIPPRERGAVIPFVATSGRRFRHEEDDGSRGRILLFTGIRYERLPETIPVPQRRRS